jgi:hypothetical protein
MRKVGIGTANPNSKLHINPNTTSTVSPNTTGVYVYNKTQVMRRVPYESTVRMVVIPIFHLMLPVMLVGLWEWTTVMGTK